MVAKRNKTKIEVDKGSDRNKENSGRTGVKKRTCFWLNVSAMETSFENLKLVKTTHGNVSFGEQIDSIIGFFAFSGCLCSILPIFKRIGTIGK